MRGDNVMGGRVGGGEGGHRRRRGRKEGENRERTEGRVEQRCGGVRSELEHEAARCSPLPPKIEPLGVFLFFFSSSSTSSSPPRLTEKKRERFLRGKFTAGQKASERLRGSSPGKDGPRRVFEEAALLSEGGLALEHRPPFQEGRTRRRGRTGIP